MTAAKTYLRISRRSICLDLKLSRKAKKSALRSRKVPRANKHQTFSRFNQSSPSRPTRRRLESQNYRHPLPGILAGGFHFGPGSIESNAHVLNQGLAKRRA